MITKMRGERREEQGEINALRAVETYWAAEICSTFAKISLPSKSLRFARQANIFKFFLRHESFKNK
jgi:hypothetical protein